MLPAIASKPGATERFLREAQSAAALKHEHVVTIYQVGIARGDAVHRSGVTPRRNARGLSAPQRSMSVREVVRIGREIAMGLAAAHAQGPAAPRHQAGQHLAGEDRNRRRKPAGSRQQS